jgi:hypothetical protein
MNKIKFLSVIFVITLLQACADPPTGDAIKSAAENCTSLHKQIYVNYSSAGGYVISCQ